ncbi:MAG: hypothetical protein ACRC5C_06505, partial [Bacilli bacterium]
VRLFNSAVKMDLIQLTRLALTLISATEVVQSFLDGLDRVGCLTREGTLYFCTIEPIIGHELTYTKAYFQNIIKG